MFKNRAQAGHLLARLLKKYTNKNVCVYGLARGGGVVAFEIAKHLKAPLRALVVRKIGHPHNDEFAIAAVTENCEAVSSDKLNDVSRQWLREEITHEKSEAKRLNKLYALEADTVEVRGKLCIIVDDGAATGLTMEAAIKELRSRGVGQIVVAIPVAPMDVVKRLLKESDDQVVLESPIEFRGSVGSYYMSFPQVETLQAIALIRKAMIGGGVAASSFLPATSKV